jgi:prevent-host-death family protein
MLNDSWKLQDAKNHFSEVVESAMKKGPQHVTKHGKDAVVVLSFELYQKLVRPKNDLVDFFQSSPLKGIDLDIERHADIPRDIDL